jgi:shikimate kinase
MKIVITGFMGSGKTRLARELARRLNLEMVDLDDRVTEREGRSPAQLIVEEGEEAFRLIESDVLRELLETEGAGVIALGGGAWIVDANRQLIDKHDCLTVWLDVPFGLCWARIETSGEDRPLGRTKEQAKALFNQRRPIYQLAKIRFEVKGEVDLDSLVTQLDLSRRFRR